MSQDISTERLDELIDDVAGEIVCAADTDWNRERKQMKRDHELALLELKRRRSEDCWQPIESAPKDGTTEILTYRGAGLQAVAAYFPYGKAEWCCADGMHLLNVTHWRPIPAAPKES